jgi:hypothetical protein
MGAATTANFVSLTGVAFILADAACAGLTRPMVLALMMLMATRLANELIIVVQVCVG